MSVMCGKDHIAFLIGMCFSNVLDSFMTKWFFRNLHFYFYPWQQLT